MPHKFVVRKLKMLFIYRVLHIDDTAHRIALGLAIGIFVAWTPTLGFQMALTVLLSALFGANKLVGVPFVWISNPVTAIPLYGANYVVGTWTLPANGYSLAAFCDSLRGAILYSGSWMGRVSAWWEATGAFFWPLWTGSIIVGLVLAVTCYFVIRYSVTTYRKHWPQPHPPMLHSDSRWARETEVESASDDPGSRDIRTDDDLDKRRKENTDAQSAGRS